MAAWLNQRRGGGIDSMTRSTIVLGYDPPTFQSDMKRNFTPKESEYSTKEAVDRLRDQKRGAQRRVPPRHAAAASQAPGGRAPARPHHPGHGPARARSRRAVPTAAFVAHHAGQRARGVQHNVDGDRPPHRQGPAHRQAALRDDACASARASSAVSSAPTTTRRARRICAGITSCTAPTRRTGARRSRRACSRAARRRRRRPSPRTGARVRAAARRGSARARARVPSEASLTAGHPLRSPHAHQRGAGQRRDGARHRRREGRHGGRA